MTVLNLEAFAKPERLTTQLTTKVTPSEHQELLEALEVLKDAGADEVTTSSFVRTAVMTFARAVKAEKEATP